MHALVRAPCLQCSIWVAWQAQHQHTDSLLGPTLTVSLFSIMQKFSLSTTSDLHKHKCWQVGAVQGNPMLGRLGCRAHLFAPAITPMPSPFGISLVAARSRHCRRRRGAWQLGGLAESRGASADAAAEVEQPPQTLKAAADIVAKARQAKALVQLQQYHCRRTT
jgi:hypothetical protein